MSNIFLKKVATFEWNEEQDAGKPLIQATEERIRLFPEWEQPLRDFYGRWEEMLKGPIRDTVEIFRSLKETQAYRFYALSNWSAENFHVALDRFEFLHWFDGRLIMGKKKMAKPNPAFFKLLETRYDVIPQNAVYIDDNFRNYKAAEALGFLAIHFISPEQLKGDLENYSIEI